MKAEESSKAEEKESSGSALQSSQGEDTTAPSGQAAPPTAVINPEKPGNAVSPEKPPDEQRPESPKPTAAAVVPNSAPNSGELLLPLFFSVVDACTYGLRHTKRSLIS